MQIWVLPLYVLGNMTRLKNITRKHLRFQKDFLTQAEATVFGSLGDLFCALGEYGKAKEYLAKALKINREIGDKSGEATVNGNLGDLLFALGEHGEAKKYYEKAIAISSHILET